MTLAITEGASLHRMFACFLAMALAAGPVVAQTTPQDSSAAQPNLPQAAPGPQTKPGSPIVEQLVQPRATPLVVRKRVARSHVVVVRRVRVARHRRVYRELDRPALAGVALVAPLPPPQEPPHYTVPLPAYPLDTLATAFTAPPPPIVCHPTRRDPDAPDPHLYRELPVTCEPDNP